MGIFFCISNAWVSEIRQEQRGKKRLNGYEHMFWNSSEFSILRLNNTTGRNMKKESNIMMFWSKKQVEVSKTNRYCQRFWTEELWIRIDQPWRLMSFTQQSWKYKMEVKHSLEYKSHYLGIFEEVWTFANNLWNPFALQTAIFSFGYFLTKPHGRHEFCFT